MTVIVFHNDKQLNFKDLDADEVAYLQQCAEALVATTPRRSAMLVYKNIEEVAHNVLPNNFSKNLKL